MTNTLTFTGRSLNGCWAGAMMMMTLLAATGAHSQGLRVPGAARAPEPAVSATPRATGPQRQADFIVAVVNSEPITNSEVRTKLLRTAQQAAQQGGVAPPRNELLPQVLERMISDKALLQLARSSGVRIDESAVDNTLQTIARQNQITADELRQRLRAEGIDYNQFRAEIRDELLVSRLLQREVESRVTVTEQEIDQFLRDQEGASDLSSLGINLGEILIAVPENATPEQLTALQARARQVADRARSGGDFAALVTEYSNSPSRANGGQMGLRSADRYPPLFVEATKNLKVGEVSAPTRSGAGFHVLKVLEKRRAGVTASVPQTHARHILLKVSPQLSEAAAVERLAAVRKKILAGQADFAALARELGQDGSAQEGGDLGWATPGMFVPEFEKVMNALALNEISEPLISRFGVHLLQVLERRDLQLTSREQREMARNALREKKKNEATALWVEEVRGKAYVEFRESPQ